MPHKPLAVSEAWYQKSGHGLYADVIGELDAAVGALLAAVREHGLEERTLVFFTSDNGPWFGGSTGGLRGMKGETWEGGLRVPGIARWPRRIPPGQVLDAPCATVDVLPTILAAAGVEVSRDGRIDGVNLLGYLAGGAAPDERPIYGMRGDRLLTVRRGSFKLHVAPARAGMLADFRARPGEWIDPRAPDGVTILAPFEQARADQYPGVETGDRPRGLMLVDLAADPAEQHDVAARHPQVVEQLVADYEAALATLPEPLKAVNPSVDLPTASRRTP
jgi:uncharacterized sulfatase